MKKGLLWILVLTLLVSCLGGCTHDESPSTEPASDSVLEFAESNEIPSLSTDTQYQVAIVADYSGNPDMSQNQAAYEAGRNWCETYHIPYFYYSPDNDSTEARIVSIEQAISEGANVLILPGYSFGGAIYETAEKHPDVYYIALDIHEADIALYDDDYYAGGNSYVWPKNVLAVSYQEELAGFLAGYAVVKMGHRDLAFVGGMAVPAVIRYGYGFLQGADYAAKETGGEVSVKYGYSTQCFCDARYTSVRDSVDAWFREGLDVVFLCGCSAITYTYIAELERPYDLRIIGVDRDLKSILDGLCGEGTVPTSAMKNLNATVSWALSKLMIEDDWDSIGGTAPSLGLVSSEDLEKNHVALPDSTQWNEGFTREDYASIVNALVKGEVTVDPSIESSPITDHITVDWMDAVSHQH